ncbi:MAG: transcription elongation factor GreA [Candidatus Binatia bacterium]|nr:transcription elongation factor GreA [Candidatus Binatia bacterium]
MKELPIIVKLKEELGDLQVEMTQELPKRLEEARAHGDLRENAEYDAAKNRQGLVRARMAQIRERIGDLSVYDRARIPLDRASYGSRVTVEDADSGAEVEYHIVFPEEVERGTPTISISSPIGQALLNKAVGDEVVVHTPNGKKNIEILDLKTLHDLED